MSRTLLVTFTPGVFLCMMITLFLLSSIITRAETAAGQHTPAPIKVSAKFDAKGLAALDVAGSNMLAESNVQVSRVRVTDKYRNPYEMPDPYIDDMRTFRDASTTVTGVRVDAKQHRVSYSYAWGTLAITYTPIANRLDATVVIQNTSAEVIEQVDFNLLTLALAPDTKADLAYTSAWMGPNRGVNIGEPMLLVATAKTDPMLVLCSPQPDRPLRMQLAKNAQNKFALAVTVGDERQTEIYDRTWNVRAIKPKSSETVKLSLRFGQQGIDPYDLATDVCADFAKAHSMILKWADRRPILGVLPSKGGGEWANWNINPRGWWDMGDKSIYTPEGKANFKKWLNGFIDSVIASGEQSGSQGVIFWNIEGGQWFWVAFYGAPELTPFLAPEMDEVADEVCARLKAAGLRVGFCIRPTEIFPMMKTDVKDVLNELPSWEGINERNIGNLKTYDGDMPFKPGTPVDDTHIERSPVARLSAKIAYAKKRWGATLFYIDSNGYNRPTVQQNGKANEKKTAWRTLSAAEWQTLSKMYPDVLLIPEHEYDEYWSATAPYQQPPAYGGMTRHDIHTIYPEAFTTIALFGGMEGQQDIAAHMQEYTNALQQGDVILYPGWMPTPQPVLTAYRNAAALAPVKVTILKNAALTLQGKPIANTPAFMQALTKLVKGKALPERRVYIQFDKSIDRQILASVVNNVWQAGGIIAWSQPLP